MNWIDKITTVGLMAISVITMAVLYFSIIFMANEILNKKENNDATITKVARDC